MSFIIAILLATTLTFACLFFKERKKIAHKNYVIDELHKIMDEMKYNAVFPKKEAIMKELEIKANKEIEHILGIVRAQQQNYSYQQAAMQNAASRGNGSGYGLNNALGMLGMGSRL